MPRDDFQFKMEAEVYELTGNDTLADESEVIHEKRLGRVSLGLENIELQDKEVFELLDTAHAEISLASKFGEFHDTRTGWKRTLGVDSRSDVHFESVWMDGYISTEYLQELCTKFDDGGQVIFSLAKFDTPIESRAESIVRNILSDKEEFDVTVH